MQKGPNLSDKLFFREQGIVNPMRYFILWDEKNCDLLFFLSWMGSNTGKRKRAKKKIGSKVSRSFLFFLFDSRSEIGFRCCQFFTDSKNGAWFGSLIEKVLQIMQDGAESRNRTGTVLSNRRIFLPLRLSPPR
jgi:hypothetical protein